MQSLIRLRYCELVFNLLIDSILSYSRDSIKELTNFKIYVV